jgi:hypothetical protein
MAANNKQTSSQPQVTVKPQPVTETTTATQPATVVNSDTSAPEGATDTTTSGDSKGTVETVTAADVGNLNDVLGGDTGVTLSQRTPVPGVDATAPTPTPEQVAAVTAKATVAAERVATINKTVNLDVVVKNTGAVSDEQLPEVVAAMKVGTMQTQSAMHALLEYVQEMLPAKPQTESSIHNSQIKLLTALYTILSAEDENFATVFRGVIAIIKAHRNQAFKITSRSRGLNSISTGLIDNKNMRFLTRVIDLLVVTAGLTDISKAKEHVDFAKLLDSVTNVRAKQNLTAFYS